MDEKAKSIYELNDELLLHEKEFQEFFKLLAAGKKEEAKELMKKVFGMKGESNG